MPAGEAKKFSNVSATSAAFPLQGGTYQVAVVATFGGGSVGLQMLGPDGSTWLAVHAALTAAGAAVVDIPQGQFRLAITTATAVYASVISVPAR
jgi:hypothetical protein